MARCEKAWEEVADECPGCSVVLLAQKTEIVAQRQQAVSVALAHHRPEAATRFLQTSSSSRFGLNPGILESMNCLRKSLIGGHGGQEA